MEHLLAPKMLISPGMTLLTLAPLRLGAAFAFLSLSLACSSSSGSPGHDGGAEPEAGRDAPRGPEADAASCNAVGILPAIVYVTSATTGEQICDAVIISSPDGGPTTGDAGPGIGYPCATDYGGCPSSPPDGGKESCILAVGGTQLLGQTIEISAPGYAPQIVRNVSTGMDGCVSHPTEGTKVHVQLTPLADGGDAG
jgi:hypothetical protein